MKEETIEEKRERMNKFAERVTRMMMKWPKWKLEYFGQWENFKDLPWQFCSGDYPNDNVESNSRHE